MLTKLFFWERNDTQKFCQAYIPILQEYYIKNQKYPFALRDVARLEDVNENIDKRCGYDTNQSTFSFSFSDTWFNIKGYESQSNVWWQD